MEENIKKSDLPSKQEKTQGNNQKEGSEIVGSGEISRAERREKIAKTIRELGLWNINKAALAREFKISEAQIRRDIKYLIKKIPKDEIIESRKEILEFAKKSMKDLRRQIFDSQGEEKRKAIDRGIAIAKTLTEAYEAYGLKEPAAQKYQFEGLAGTFNLITKSIKEIKNEKDKLKGEKPGDKPETGRDPAST